MRPVGMADTAMRTKDMSTATTMHTANTSTRRRPTRPMAHPVTSTARAAATATLMVATKLRLRPPLQPSPR